MASLGYGMLIVCLVALGGYFAATEGVMTALAGAVLPEKLQASGIGILITVVSIGSLALLARLRRALVRDRPAERGADLRRRPGAGDRGWRRRCCRARSEPLCMDSRSKKILAALVVLCVVAGGAYVAVAALGPDQTTTDARPEAGAVLANTDLMVRAVDPNNPRLNGRVYEVDDGKVQAPLRRPRLRARLLRRRARDLHGGRPLRGRLRRDDLRRRTCSRSSTRSPSPGCPRGRGSRPTAATGR